MPPTTRTVAPSLPDLLRAHSTYSNTLTTVQSTSVAKSPKSKKAKLVELDEWFRGTLREDVKGKGKERVGLDKDQLKRLMEWKLTRGIFRATLPALIASNSPDLISSTTQAASLLAAIPALKHLVKELKGVGPATASAILSTWYPDLEPFMSDEGIDYVHLVQGKKGAKREYTQKSWESYREGMKEALKRDEEAWKERGGMEGLEKAIWSWFNSPLSGSEEKEEEEEEESQIGVKKVKSGVKRKVEMTEALEGGIDVSSRRASRRKI